MSQKKTYHLTSLGCPKNDVDSSSMGQLLAQTGYQGVVRPEDADILIVNTCGFIAEAREENYQVLRERAAHKLPGQLLIAAGCLTQRYGQEVIKKIPQIDGILGTRRWMEIIDLIRDLRSSKPGQPPYEIPEPSQIKPDPVDQNGAALTLRAYAEGPSAYLKIADGCRRTCAFCAIPLIKGIAASRPIQAIVEDARRLGRTGVRELILIAQDTTDYGHDLGLKDGLVSLLDALTQEVPQVDWIRLMYAYPGAISNRLIDLMADRKQILPYLDIPLQHADPRILSSMRRPSDVDWVRRTIESMRKQLPDLAIRTAFIVGYPGETEKEFQTLLDLIDEIRFDRVGVFQFSFELGTPSEPLGDPVPAEIKQERRDRLMERQQSISLQINQGFIGKKMDVMIESIRDDHLRLGRSYRDAPGIDGSVIVEGLPPIGEIVPVQITSAFEYDLSGVWHPKVE